MKTRRWVYNGLVFNTPMPCTLFLNALGSAQEDSRCASSSSCANCCVSVNEEGDELQLLRKEERVTKPFRPPFSYDTWQSFVCEFLRPRLAPAEVVPDPAGKARLVNIPFLFLFHFLRPETLTPVILTSILAFSFLPTNFSSS